MKSDGKSGDLYVVRGGAGHGIHKTWAAALNAGWYQKQAFGMVQIVRFFIVFIVY